MIESKIQSERVAPVESEINNVHVGKRTAVQLAVCLTFVSVLFETPARISLGMDALVGVARDSGSKLHGG